MPIAEILVGISLVKASASAIKEGCSAAKSLSDMATSVDALFEGTKQVQKARANQSGMSMRDQLGAGSAAQEVIDARLAKELLHEARMAISMRFGLRLFNYSKLGTRKPSVWRRSRRKPG